jgi:F-type H+-transporting ATPase subunit delta
VTSRSAGKRYAAALFEAVSKQGDAQRTARDLAAVSDLVARHAELRQVLTAAAVPPAKKRAIVSAVLEAAGGVSPDVARALQLLAEHDRIELVSDLAEAFGERLREAERILPAEIVTAVPLGDGQRAALQSAIAKASGKSVTLSARVDPAIMGGIVARVGSVVFDGSVTRQLERLKQRLSEGQ